MNTKKSFFFGPWCDGSDRFWFVLYAFGIVVSAKGLTERAWPVAYHLLGASVEESLGFAALAVLTLFVALGICCGIRRVEAYSIGLCAVAYAIVCIRVSHFGMNAVAGVIFELACSAVILWVLGHHPRGSIARRKEKEDA